MKISFSNAMHLGDCMVQTHYMKGLCRLMPEATFELFCNPDHCAECREFAGPLADRIAFLPWADRSTSAINSNIGEYLKQYIEAKANRIPGFEHKYNNRHFNGLRPYDMDYGIFYTDWFHKLSEENHLPNPINTGNDLLFEIPETQAPKIQSEIGDWDFLVINARSLMDEYPYRVDDWNWLLSELKKRGTVICTHPNTEKVFSTLEHKWSLCDVGRAAMRSRHVIAVHTSPLWAAMNTVAIKTVQFWLIFTRGHYFKFNDRFHWSRDWDWGMRILRENHIL